MSKRLQIIRSANATAVLSNGEMQWDFASQKLRIHDGYTAGGRAVIDMTQTGFAYVFPTPLAGGYAGPDWTSTTESIITASDAQVLDYFGWSVSISSDGTYAIVGAYEEDGGAGDPISNAGAVYVYVRSDSTWSQQAILRASDAQASDKFGQSVSISGDGSYAIVGARGENSNAGAVYVFTRSGSTWTQQAKLTASDAEANDQFGWSVSINPDATYAAVGARWFGRAGAAEKAGAAYIYKVS